MALSLFGTPRRQRDRSRPARQTPLKGLRYPSQTPPPISISQQTPYESFSSVHIHLPEASGSRGSRGVDFPYDSLNIEDDAEDMDEELSQVEMRHNPEHALSSCYHASTSTLARVINNGYTLEFRYIAPSVSRRITDHISETFLRINFTSRLQDISTSHPFHFSSESRLSFFILDSKSRIYRFFFPDPREEIAAGRPAYRFDVKDMHLGWLTMSEQDMVASGLTLNMNRTGGVVWSVRNEDELVMGVQDGLIRCRLGDDDWTHEYFKRPTSLTSLFRSSSDYQTQLISLSAFDPSSSTSYIYGVTRDKKLRIWNAATLGHEGIVDLAHTTSFPIDAKAVQVHHRQAEQQKEACFAPLVQVVAGTQKTPYGRYVITFTPTPRSPEGAGYFQVFGVGREENRKEHLSHVGFFTCSSETVGTEFRGFNTERMIDKKEDQLNEIGEDEEHADRWRLWTAWDIKGKHVLEWSDITALIHPKEQDRGNMGTNGWQIVKSSKESLGLLPVFDSAYFDAFFERLDEIAEMDGNADLIHADDTAEFFLDHLFCPGRFSMSVLEAAYTEYISNASQPEEATNKDNDLTLREKIGRAIGRELYRKETSGYEDLLEMQRGLRLEWQGFWVSVQQLDIQGRWPLCLVPSSDTDGSGAMVICREGLVLPQVEDDLTLMRRLASTQNDLDLEELGEEFIDPTTTDATRTFLQAPEGAMALHHGAIAAYTARADLLSIIASASSIASSFTPRDLADFYEALNSSLGQGHDVSLVELANSAAPCLGREPYDEPSLSMSMAQLGKCSSPQKAIYQLLDALGDLSSDSRSQKLFDSFTGVSLRVASMQHIIAVRQLVTSELVVLVCYLIQAKPVGVVDWPKQKDAYNSIAARALASFHAWNTIKWLVEQDGEECRKMSIASVRNEQTNAWTSYLALCKEQGVRPGGTAQATPYSLVHMLLSRQTEPLPVLTLTPASLLRNSLNALSRLHLVKREREIRAGPTDTQMAMDIVLSGNPGAALDFVQKYPITAGLEYVSARASIIAAQDQNVLTSQFSEQSPNPIDSLQNVAAVIAIDEWGQNDNTGLASILPDAVRWIGLAAYYEHVHDVCRDSSLNGPSIVFARLAVSEQCDVSKTRALRQYLFRQYLDLCQYEEAWQIMLDNPYSNYDSTDQERPLGELIHSMCQAGETQRLFALPFSGMEGYIEDELDLKARTSDPLAVPSYHKILYAWLVMRQDFRKAAYTMYQYSQRLKEVVPNNVAAHVSIMNLRSRSLLAALSNLALVDESNAWFTTVASTRSSTEFERSSKRMRVSTNVPAELYTNSVRRPMDIVTIDHIRRESDLLLKSLTIAQQAPNQIDPATPLGAEVCISMLSGIGLFDQAFMSADIQRVEKDIVFEHLATRCLEMSGLTDEAIRATGIGAWLETSFEISTWHGTLAEKAWRYLETALSQHDVSTSPPGRPSESSTMAKPVPGFGYHLVVLRKILELAPESGLPRWLTAKLAERCPDALGREGLKVGAVVMAANWTMDGLRAAQARRVDTVDNGIVAPQFSPFNTVDQVMASLKECKEGQAEVAMDSLRVEGARRIRGIKSLMSTVRDR